MSPGDSGAGQYRCKNKDAVDHVPVPEMAEVAAMVSTAVAQCRIVVRVGFGLAAKK